LAYKNHKKIFKIINLIFFEKRGCTIPPKVANLEKTQEIFMRFLLK